MRIAATLREKIYLSRGRVLLRRAGLRRVLVLLAAWRARRARNGSALPRGELVTARFGEFAARFHVSTPEECQRVRTLGGEKRFLGRLLEEVRPGDVACDIGSNFGLYTVFLAQAVGARGCVLGFEPERRSFERCRENLRLNALENVRLFDCALGEVEKQAALVVAESAASGVHRVSSHGAAPGARVQPVRVVTGDRFFAEHSLPVLNVLKLDVEGMEEEVLHGFAEMLRRPECRLVFCEVHFAILDERGRWDAPRRIIEFLDRCGFRRIDWLNSGHFLAHKQPRGEK